MTKQELIEENERLQNQVERLQRILDSRPALNAGLVEKYIEWSHGIYASEYAQITGVN